MVESTECYYGALLIWIGFVICTETNRRCTSGALATVPWFVPTPCSYARRGCLECSDNCVGGGGSWPNLFSPPPSKRRSKGPYSNEWNDGSWLMQHRNTPIRESATLKAFATRQIYGFLHTHTLTHTSPWIYCRNRILQIIKAKIAAELYNCTDCLQQIMKIAVTLSRLQKINMAS